MWAASLTKSKEKSSSSLFFANDDTQTVPALKEIVVAMEKLFYTVRETAHILGISERTIYNSTHRNSERNFIKPRWFGSKPLFHRDDIKKYAESLPTEIPAKRRGRKKVKKAA
jgi:excisionase family DNA binding protein